MPDRQTRRILVFAYGNPSRGDDALAPMLVEKLRHHLLQSTQHAHHLPEIEYLTDFQLQIEHVTDLQNRDRVLMIDADSAIGSPYHFYSVPECAQTHYTTHGMSPSQLLSVYRQVFGAKAPPVFMLAIRGQQFNLGEPLSPQAEKDFAQALSFAIDLLKRDQLQDWFTLAR